MRRRLQSVNVCIVKGTDEEIAAAIQEADRLTVRKTYIIAEGHVTMIFAEVYKYLEFVSAIKKKKIEVYEIGIPLGLNGL